MTALPILYSFRRCPYAMRARLALLASKTPCEIREVKLSAKPDDLIAASQKATVPVLVLADGSVIDQSLDIMRWALARNDPKKWLERADFARIEINDGAFKHHLDRYKYPDRHASDPLEHRSAGLTILQQLDALLVSAANLPGANLSGDAPGLTDAAIMPFIRQFAATDRDWFDAQTLPHLQPWLERHLASDSFAAIMIRLTPWQSGDAPIIVPKD